MRKIKTTNLQINILYYLRPLLYVISSNLTNSNSSCSLFIKEIHTCTNQSSKFFLSLRNHNHPSQHSHECTQTSPLGICIHAHEPFHTINASSGKQKYGCKCIRAVMQTKACALQTSAHSLSVCQTNVLPWPPPWT